MRFSVGMFLLHWPLLRARESLSFALIVSRLAYLRCTDILMIFCTVHPHRLYSMLVARHYLLSTGGFLNLLLQASVSVEPK